MIMIPFLEFFNELICRRCNSIDDENHRLIAANTMSQNAIVLETNIRNARILQSDPNIFVGSTFHPDISRVVRPEIIDKRLAIDEARNNKTQEFERRLFCDRISILRRLPTIPKINIT